MSWGVSCVLCLETGTVEPAGYICLCGPLYNSDTKWHCRRSNISPYCIFWGWHVPPNHFKTNTQKYWSGGFFPEDCYVTPGGLTLECFGTFKSASTVKHDEKHTSWKLLEVVTVVLSSPASSQLVGSREASCLLWLWKHFLVMCLSASQAFSCFSATYILPNSYHLVLYTVCTIAWN